MLDAISKAIDSIEAQNLEVRQITVNAIGRDEMLRFFQANYLSRGFYVDPSGNSKTPLQMAGELTKGFLCTYNGVPVYVDVSQEEDFKVYSR